MSGAEKIVLGYWDFRGYGEACRYMLEYSGATYEDKQYPRLSGNDHSAWRDVSESFGLDFPNLPYLIDGTRRLTESLAILKYLGRKYDLVPQAENDKIRTDMLEGVVLELRQRFYSIFFCPEGQYKKYAGDFISDARGLHVKLKKVVKFICSRKWLVSDKLTYVDFLFYAQMSQIMSLFPKSLDGFDQIKKYMENFRSLPAIKSYLESGRFVEYPEHDPYIRLENKIE